MIPNLPIHAKLLTMQRIARILCILLTLLPMVTKKRLMAVNELVENTLWDMFTMLTIALGEAMRLYQLFLLRLLALALSKEKV